ncbi:hypothetical protein [Bacillus tropicus]|uniref:hypothetical protein n=1 Tax=Bacillus tropicus TaxID=2026188 RepID=UPI001CFF1FBF|nr:hypothetical protein [Bacillus tropicus]USK97370.1 hypothetical protein LIS81_01860 [Bacillus tropicus]
MGYKVCTRNQKKYIYCNGYLLSAAMNNEIENLNTITSILEKQRIVENDIKIYKYGEYLVKDKEKIKNILSYNELGKESCNLTEYRGFFLPVLQKMLLKYDYVILDKNNKVFLRGYKVLKEQDLVQTSDFKFKDVCNEEKIVTLSNYFQTINASFNTENNEYGIETLPIPCGDYNELIINEEASRVKLLGMYNYLENLLKTILPENDWIVFDHEILMHEKLENRLSKKDYLNQVKFNELFKDKQIESFFEQSTCIPDIVYEKEKNYYKGYLLDDKGAITNIKVSYDLNELAQLLINEYFARFIQNKGIRPTQFQNLMRHNQQDLSDIYTLNELVDCGIYILKY